MRTVAVAFLVILIVGLVSATNSYIGAIAEHNINLGKSGDLPSDLLQLNLNIYERHIQLAKSKQAQVIVFPEFGLTAVDSSTSSNFTRSDLYPFAEMIPDPAVAISSIIPCENGNFSTNSILARISCAARDNQILVLINTIDWVNCDVSRDVNCPSDAHYQYNTDVLFDESGQLVAKYHKSHEWPPYIGPYDQVPTSSEVTYTSSFGVTFGLFICYDIVFPSPAKTLRQSGITHFLYAVAQGDVGLKTLITDWSKNQESVLLAANLGAGLKEDCSGFVMNGTLLDNEKIYLGKDYPNENLIVSTIPF